LTPCGWFTIIVHANGARAERAQAAVANGGTVGIGELIVVLIVALIIIPPEKLPEVMRTAGRILRELRVASNTVVRELTDAIDDPLNMRRPPAPLAKPPVAPPPGASPPAASASADKSS